MKVIIVRGGLVQSVYSNRREKIHVFDYDGDDQKEHDEYKKKLEALIKKYKLKAVY